MAIPIREQQDAGTNLALSSFTLGAATSTTDLLVAIAANDYYTTAKLTTPTGTAASTWTLQHTLDGGTNGTHIKVWTAPVTTGGAQTVVEGATPNDEERYFGVWVLNGSGGTPAFDTAASSDITVASTSEVAPSVTPAAGKTDDLLICLFATFGATAAGATNFTTMPSGMTARTERDVATFCTYRAADEQLASASATGTRTANTSSSEAYSTVSVLIKSAAASAAATLPAPCVLGQAVNRASTY